MGRTRFAMMIGKLVVLAAALSAVAYAAPSMNVDTVVPEEMVQTASQVATGVEALKKQFATLQSQLQDTAYAQVTPAVANVIDKMIDMVDEEIMPAINEAHASDQDELNAKHKLITDFNTDSSSKKEILYNEFRSINDDIAAHNVAAQQWDDAAAAYSASVDLYEKTVKEKTDTCCDKQQAAVGAIEYTPAYASCDYTSADAAKCTDTATGNVATAVKADFTHGLKRYRDLVHGCSTKTDEVASTGDDMNSKDKHCDDSQADCNLRKGEWGSTQEIKCLLQAYKSGGTFDEAEMIICKGKITTSNLVIHYEPVPPQVQWPLDDYDAMTDTTPYSETCQRVEKADEAADTHCELKATPIDSTCDKSSADDGPVWTLSTAGASFVH